MLRTLLAITASILLGALIGPQYLSAASSALPIRGPADEPALLLVGVLLWVFHRDSLKDAWAASHVS